MSSYIPESDGKCPETGKFHYRCIVDAFQVTGSSMKTKVEMISKIQKAESLDGAGMMHLLLQVSHKIDLPDPF